MFASHTRVTLERPCNRLVTAIADGNCCEGSKSGKCHLPWAYKTCNVDTLPSMPSLLPHEFSLVTRAKKNLSPQCEDFSVATKRQNTFKMSHFYHWKISHSHFPEVGR